MSSLRTSAFVFFSLIGTLLNSEVTSAQQKTAPPAEKQKAPADKSKGIEQVLQLSGWPIHMTYFESPAGKESPVVILLTSTEGADKKDARNRQIWQPTALILQKSGFAVVTVDLRKHGDSVLPAGEGKESSTKMGADDYTMMAAGDLEAVKVFLMEEHTAERLNIAKLGIVSMGSSAMVAAAFAVADWDKKPYPDGPTPATSTPRGQDVKALIAYSPNTSVKGINSTSILKAIKPLLIAVHVIASKDNKTDAKNAEKYFKAVDLKDETYKEFRRFTPVPGEIHSERFLEGKFAEATNKDIADFLTKNLKDMQIPWISRKDRRLD